MRIAGKDILAISLSLLLLGGAAMDRISLLPPKDAGPYQERVRAAAGTISLNFGDWVGRDLPIPPEASAQLHPNVMISRQFTNASTGQRASLLLVQCWDVRDLVPHYPPICYPGRGLTLTWTDKRKDWRIGAQTVTGTEYQFESNTFETNKLTIVDNFMLLPDGRTCRDMSDVRKLIGLRTRFFGAAQVQIVFDSDTTAAERDKVCCELIAQYQPLIAAIGSGVRK